MNKLARAARLTVWLMIASPLVMAGARGEDAFPTANVPGKLPKTVVPVHYAIDLTPDLDKLTIAGAEVVDIDVKAPTNRLVLNATRMTFASAVLDGIETATVSVNADEETVILTFPRDIAAGRHSLRIVFSARINERVGGPFRVDYQIGQTRKRIFATHLQPDEARQVFPSWDEPAFKATFEVTVTVPRSFLAVSNMPVAKEVPVAGARKRVSFQRTPVMPTYIFGLVAGELERTTLESAGVTIGVVATPGNAANARYALESAAALLKFYDDYTGVKYPLPKLDLIAIPGLAGEAHENWGAITFQENSLLLKSSPATDASRRRIFMLVAHEMAHQWFGDLVTMAWWDNVWLNEAFATWMETKVVQRHYPNWPSWLYAANDKQSAMDIDAGPSAYPVHRPGTSKREINAVFEVMTYNKGAAVVRMLENYLGETVFRDGVRRYMAKHVYGNTVPTDLWSALEEASGKPVGALAAAYIEQPGIPLVSVESACIDGEQRLKLTQGRFTIRSPDAAPLRWRVPIAAGPIASEDRRDITILDGQGELAAGACGDAFKLNLGNAGYYRVEYDTASHRAQAKAIAAMMPADRINLLDDTWALIQGGRKPPSIYAELIENLVDVDDPHLWEQLLPNIRRIDTMNRGRHGRAAFQAFIRLKLRPVVDRLGWEPAADEPPERAELRALLIGTIGEFGDEAVLAEAKRRFDVFATAPASLAADLRDPVIHLAGRGADRATYNTLLALARKVGGKNERNRYYSAAAAALDPGLAKQTLAMTLDRDIPSDVVVILLNGVATEHRDLAWEFVRANFSALSARQGRSFKNSFVPKLMAEFTDPARATDLAGFSPALGTARAKIEAERAQERIVANAEFVARAMPALDDWLAQRALRQ